MNDSISLTVPMTFEALSRASDMLHGLANDCHGGAAHDSAVPAHASPRRQAAPDEPGNDQPAATTAAAPDGGEATQASASAGDARVDHKGVPFDPAFCGEAAEPFYGSGKRAGQWKKRRGVEEADYDAWHASQCTAAPASAEAEPDAAPANAGAAFAPPASTAASAPTTPAQPTPSTAGELMQWVSEKQAAGLLTQADVNAAYAQAGVALGDLFPPTAPDVVAQNVAAAYAVLAQRAGA